MVTIARADSKPHNIASTPAAQQQGLLLLLLGVFLAASVAGCASLPTPSADWSEPHPLDTSNTTWALTLAQPAATHQGLSGVHLLTHGRDALAARLVLADTAERSLDAQYYIWSRDDSGRLLAERLMRAADRGVRVRLLLDDIGGSASDEILLALDSHTNIEVRLFNPVANRRLRMLSTFWDFERVNRRMHNKSFTADKLVTILGGRNVGDHYYAAGEHLQYADLDVIAAGPAASEVTSMFELYWYNPLSMPIRALGRKEISPEQVARDSANLTRDVEEIAQSADFSSLADNAVGAAIRRHDLPLVWGRTRLIYDLPEKATLDRRDTATHLLPQLRGIVEGAKHEVFVISPYFVPGTSGVQFFRSLRERDVRVAVLANSLASNDVIPVHAGYARYRKALLHTGVELFELKPTAEVRAADRDKDNSLGGSSSGSGLHAKAFVIDRSTLFVTSFNLDPRSASLNTEMGLVIEIPEVAGLFIDSLERRLTDNAYRLKFVPSPGPCKECGSLAWISHENGQETIYTHDPETSLYRRLLVRGLSLLPIEHQL